MSRHKKKQEGAVKWYAPTGSTRRSSIAYSSVGVWDLVVAVVESTGCKTPFEIISYIAFDLETLAVMQTYIREGFGNCSLNYILRGRR